MKQTFQILLLCAAASILYGAAHNQFSARLSPEYFTIGHERIIASTSPTLMGIAWGVRSTWWVGLLLGALLSMAGRLGPWRKRTAVSFIKPLAALFAACGIAAALAGVLGYWELSRGAVAFPGEMGLAIDPARQPAFMGALWMHTASYTVSAMGAVLISVGVLSSRRREGAAS